ncbi:hypothetical protein DFH11DRAFT_1561560 [Phellopilus nigrolimitatus]|nr:hypothetical protein DFH11DRAFT_1561560 [Phellopilus nigrolimitatus]
MRLIKPMKSLADRLNRRRNLKDATSDEFAAVQEASDDPNIVRKLVKMSQKTTNPAATRDSPPACNIPLIGNASAPPSEEFFNNSLYNAAHPTSEIPEFDDECENLNNQMTAVKEGIKVRDFAFAPEAVLGLKPLTSGAMLDERVPILFQPIQPYSEFLYMRKVCFQAGKFDMPAIHLTPEDVDRLHTMGWISLHDVKDFALWRMGKS